MLELEQSGTEASKLSNVVSLKDAQSKRLPGLKEIARQDPEIRAFLKLVHEEDLREEAMRLLDIAIEKASRPTPQRPITPPER